jgi:hypothetical protein
VLDEILRFERSRSADSLAHADFAPVETVTGKPDLVLNFTGSAEAQQAPVLTLAFNGQRDLVGGLAAALADKFNPCLVAELDGKPVAVARPMLDDRVWLGRAASDLLSGAVNLIEMCVRRYASGTLRPLTDDMAQVSPAGPLLARYIPHLASGLADRAIQKLTQRRPFYWRTAYRLIDGPGIAERGRIDGESFIELPDDGQRFYADPFAFDWQGRQFLFVEEYVYGTGRGIISVAELDATGRFGQPVPVIEEPHHLSYPYVFVHGEEVYMIPESSAAQQVVLYRATGFPLRWERADVLISGHRLNDMTLLVRDGRFWLIGTEQVGVGSASDTMVVWSAPELRGPWTPHRFNPILIDHSAARPGGRFVERDGRTYLPVQDGASSYGGGLGLAELEVLNDDEVRFGPVMAIVEGAAWPGYSVHTLTRAGRLEAIDSASSAAPR